MPGNISLRRNTAWQTSCSRLIGLFYGHSNNELFRLTCLSSTVITTSHSMEYALACTKIYAHK